MARKCSSPGCAFSLPDKYPLDKCPWHLAPGKGPVKIAAAITIAAAGFGGGLAYKKFRSYLRKKEARKQRRKKTASKPEEQKATSAAGKLIGAKTPKQPRARKRTAAKSKRPTKSTTS
jgi:hypothetical protein